VSLRNLDRRKFLATLAAGPIALHAGAESQSAIRSRQSGPWSSPRTWEGDQVPSPGSTVQILSGHEVVYDVKTHSAIRVVHILGTLNFARDRDTRLDVGLLKVGGDNSEDGAACSAHGHAGSRPALEVGTADRPIPEAYSALIRLTYFKGFDKENLPSLVCCGGRMDFHGAPLSRTWLKFGAPVKKGDGRVTLEEPVTGWRAGDRIILTATTRQIPSDDSFTDTVRENTQTEERVIKSVEGAEIVLDRPAEFDHTCDGVYRGDVANLSRNVTVESAGTDAERGHTMYHHGSAGSISYAEFRHLGKRNTLGRYSLHFHQVRDTMRGSSVIGASIWNSDNRWLTIHGTDYMVVRDCVGYDSIGHGFFLEDGSEVFNVFDRNLAVQGRNGRPLPGQVLPFDHNSGSGFWWANSLNTFTRNVACECDVYGFRFDMQKAKGFDPVLGVPQTDGSLRDLDVRALGFVRFEDNEAHCQRNFALNLGGLDISLGGGCGGVGPDLHHPFIVRNMRVWNSHWSFHTLSPHVMLDNFDIHKCAYGLWKPNIIGHAYRNVHMEKISQEVLLDGKGELPKVFATGKVGPAEVFDLHMPDSGFPKPLDPVDDLAPIVVATQFLRTKKGHVTIRGTASDVGPIESIHINNVVARAVRPNFAEWEASVSETSQGFVIRAKDSAGNVSSTKVSSRQGA
jgi:hypothetical protein